MNLRALGLASLLALALPNTASAWWWHHPTCDPDSVQSGVVTIEDPNFGLYTVRKTFEVFADNNCGNPVPSTGSFTYVYTLEVLTGSTLGVQSASVGVPDSGAVVDAGFLAGGGSGVVDPSSTVVSETDVRWFFDGTANGALLEGETSAPLYLVSPYGPGDDAFTIFGQAALNAPTTCVGPSVLPEPSPCSAFFWKLRALGWFWVKHYFPGSQFDDVKTRAVELSGGYFADEGDLVSALFHWGFLNPKKRAERQLAALLLNVAAGDLFPANTKCRLFPGTELDLDGDEVADSTVDEAIGEIITKLDTTDPALHQEAFVLALDINLGRNVIGAAAFQ